METKTWLRKAGQRGLVTDLDHDELAARLDSLHLKLNAYIKSIGQKHIDH